MLGLWIALDEGLRCEVNDMCKATGKMIIQYSSIWWCTIAHRMRRSSYRNGAFVFFSMYLAKNSIIVSLFEALSQVMCPICHFVVSHNVDKINMSLPCEKSQADQQFWIGRHPVACRYAHCWVVRNQTVHSAAPKYRDVILQSSVQSQRNIHLYLMLAIHHTLGSLLLGRICSIKEVQSRVRNQSIWQGLH